MRDQTLLSVQEGLIWCLAKLKESQMAIRYFAYTMPSDELSVEGKNSLCKSGSNDSNCLQKLDILHNSILGISSYFAIPSDEVKISLDRNASESKTLSGEKIDFSDEQELL